MVSIVAQILTPAVAVAFSPMPIAALLLILLSKRAKLNSVSFLIGWIVGLWIILWIGLFTTVFAGTAADGGRSLVSHIIDGVLGIILLSFAIRNFLAMRSQGSSTKTPGWMATLEDFSPVKTFGVGLLLSTFNFKNTPMGILAGTNISQHVSSGEQFWFGVVAYLLIASSTILVPVVGFLIWGNKLEGLFSSLKNWMVDNNHTIMFVLFLILGIVILSKAFGG